MLKLQNKNKEGIILFVEADNPLQGNKKGDLRKASFFIILV